MKRPFVEKYKDYSIRYAPQETHDGRFLAFLIISHGGGQLDPDSAGSLPDLPSFAIEEDAALASLAAALGWVDEAVTPQPHMRRSTDVAVLAPALNRRSFEFRVARTGSVDGTSDAWY